MKILIPESELKELIANHLREQIPDLANEIFEVNLTATRGPDGHCAEINVERRVRTQAKEETVTEELSADEPAIDSFDFNSVDDS